MFIEVKAKYKIGDLVDWVVPYSTHRGPNGTITTCVITDVDNMADEDDNFEALYQMCELVNGRMSQESVSGGAYESELTLNKKYKRDEIINELLNESNRKEIHK